ncbi:MAG TPA: Fe-S cluster assembly ATPase SufC [Thermoplasmata archaeon]
MLEIKNLHVKIGDKVILKGINLSIKPGEVHAIMGPNGSGKTTLAQVLAGRVTFEVTQGKALFEGKDLLTMKPEDRAREGIFMAFQYPVEIPGVSNAYFLKAALNAIRKYRNQDEIDAMDFMALVQEKMKLLGLDETFMKRGLNEGFSGGEKKKNEIFQMAVLEPKFCVLDETDSGLDIDALRLVSEGINAMRSPARSMLVVTHYQRLLEYVIPDVVHVLVDGKIVKSGDADLARNLEKHGYGWILEEAPKPQPAVR